jgi:hypothetical protein
MAEAAIDTTVLRRANVVLAGNRAAAKLMARRLSLLQRIEAKQVTALISNPLVHEYLEQLRPLQNEFIRTFLELVTNPGGKHAVMNWKVSWSGGDRDRARKCRYPAEDDHVLRTAIRGEPTTIFTEENRMLQAGYCVYQEFNVRIQAP